MLSVAFAITKYMAGYEWLSKFVTIAILAGFSSVILVMLMGQSRVFRANLDIYNILNSNPVRAVNTAYASWLVPTSILDPRLFKISAQFDF